LLEGFLFCHYFSHKTMVLLRLLTNLPISSGFEKLIPTFKATIGMVMNQVDIHSDTRPCFLDEN
jgi:hypothetical protein